MEQLGKGDGKAGASSPAQHLFSESRSIYSLEIKGLQSTGHLMLPGAVGVERGSTGLASFPLCLPGAFLR